MTQLERSRGAKRALTVSAAIDDVTGDLLQIEVPDGCARARCPGCGRSAVVVVSTIGKACMHGCAIHGRPERTAAVSESSYRRELDRRRHDHLAAVAGSTPLERFDVASVTEALAS